MPQIEIDEIALIGSVQDTPAHLLPPNAWTLALNMRARDGGMERAGAWEQIFGTPGVAPHFLMPVTTASATMWLYTSLAKAYAYDGSSHTNITRQAVGVDVDYTAADTPDWNGTMFGGTPIINNGTDVPQYWPTVSVGTKLADLANWPSSLRAKVIRAFGPYLVAINITDSGTAYPHTIQWSHQAQPGNIPTSWDYSDPTVDAGRRDFPDVSSGILLDALPLGSIMYIYKAASVWKMRYIGGRFIFDFGESAWLPDVGILAPRCVAVTGDGTRHVWATQDDIKWHNGNNVESILTKKQRRRLFNEIDPANYVNSFMFANPLSNEMWFCYPGPGITHPDRALILGYGEGGGWTVTEADGITFRNAAIGDIESASAEAWSGGSDTWDEDTGPWSELIRRRVILAGTAATKFYNLDKGTTRDTVAFTGTLTREGLSVVGRKRNGDWIVDVQKMKMLKGLWPKLHGVPVSIRFGAQQVMDGATQWGVAETFDPATRRYGVPGPVSGVFPAIEMSATGHWRCDGYKIDIDVLGDF